MKHLAAYCLLVLGGKASPSKGDVQALLKASGVSADDAQLDIMMKRLEGKSIPELIAEGSGKLASMPSGGRGGAAPAGGAAAAAPVEEKPKEEEPAEDVDMGDLFGGGDDDY